MATSSPRQRRRVECLICHQRVTLNNFSTHLKLRHPVQHETPPRTRWYGEVSDPTSRPAIAAPVAAPDSDPPPGPVSHLAVADSEWAPGLPPLDLDDVVLAVVQQVTEPDGMLAVTHLPALFAWREATATFLRSMTRESHR